MRRVRTGWTTAAWRLLCLLTVMSGLAAASGLLWTLSPLWQALAVAPGLLVLLLVVVAFCADWGDGCGSSGGTPSEHSGS
ncbi:hypothetical protein [Leucobacter massiliensis]|uniref:Uncharacterized protein n=1 Tax=Leucobacter massiliensis TaxID=1686285 RepID=A0A2S9QMX9_9MICO|nr:hypothetical protein [Leucobacter massiliensis]PRI10951.1 hypothetical protein B4915_08690 [Leucobacter massiliensis]